MPAQSRVDPLDEYKRTRRLCFKPQARTSVYAIEKSDNRRNETQNFTQALIIISHNAIQKGKTPGLVALSIFLIFFRAMATVPKDKTIPSDLWPQLLTQDSRRFFFFLQQEKKKNCLQLFSPPFFLFIFLISTREFSSPFVFS